MKGRSETDSTPLPVAMRRFARLGTPPCSILKTPLIVRRAEVEETGALAALLGSAYPTETWDLEGTERELFGDPTVKATLVVDDQGQVIATASLQILSGAPEVGWLRWVATAEDRRRQGLARALVTAVLDLAERSGCEEVRLRTETDRVEAIRLYLQLGFEPLLRSDAEGPVWERVFQFLRDARGTAEG